MTVSGVCRSFKSSSAEELRIRYASSLNCMKYAHFKAFDQMKEGAISCSEGVPLVRLFSSFNPCPLKLSIIEFCGKPLDLMEVPEIFVGHEKELVLLHREYQKLSSESKKQLLEDLIENYDVEAPSEGQCFNQRLTALVEMLYEGSNSAEIPSLITLFQKEVRQAKQLVDFLTDVIKMESISRGRKDNNPLSVDILLMRALSNIMQTDELPKSQRILFLLNMHLPKLKAIKEKFDTLNLLSQYLMSLHFQHGGSLGKRLDSQEQEIISGLDEIIERIKSNNRNAMPLLLFLAYKQSR